MLNSEGIHATQAGGKKTLTALIQEQRSSGLRDLHSFLTFGVVQFPLTYVNKRAESNVTRKI